MERKSLLLSLILLLFISLSQGQEFIHMEELVGFGLAKENNGVAVADYDLDGDLDVYVVAVATDEANSDITKSKLFENNGNGTFSNVTEQSGIVDLLYYEEIVGDFHGYDGLEGYKYGASWGDFDNDGDPDLFLTHQSKVQLFENNGDKTFSEITEDAGFEQYNQCANSGATWFDYNNDGFLDIYIASWGFCEGNSFFENNGDGTFTNVSDIFTFDDVPVLYSYIPFPFDFNDDGWMDLYVTNDLNGKNQLFLNQNGESFIDVAEEYGVANIAYDMGIAFSDYDMDEDFDFFITAVDENFMFTKQETLPYTEDAEDLNVGDTGWSWGCNFSDFDLDGDEDLFVVNGFMPPIRTPEKNVYFESMYNEGTVGFRPNPDVGLNELTISVDALDFDFDLDGDLDLFVTNSDEQSYFYSNRLITTDNIDTHNYKWLKVSLEGTISNRSAIGTTLTLTTADEVYKRYYNGVGFLGQSNKPVHFGIPQNEEIISLVVNWPSGLEESFETINEKTHIKITESEGIEVIDEAPADIPTGCTDPSACNFDPDAVENDGSCNYLPTTSISGPTSSAYYAVETYSYALPSGSTITWMVDGGDIVSEYNTPTIDVKWSLAEEGLVSALIENSDCSSLPVELEVQLGEANVDEQISIARIWNEALLFCIRHDFARPTIHARNLFHISAAMYDVWAVFHNTKQYLIGKELNGFSSELETFPFNEDELDSEIRKAISYASYRLLMHRFQNAPKWDVIQPRLNHLMAELGYDTGFTNTDYTDGNSAALGNYIAQMYIQYGLSDGSRESTGYDNAHYETVNPPLAPTLPGNPNIEFPNRWQTLSLDTYIDQSGNIIEGSTIPFLSPGWGDVFSFALTDADLVIYTREDGEYNVFHDPSAPPLLDENNPESTENYLWNFALVSVWSSHLDPTDGVLWDISPKSIGNLEISSLPTNYSDYSDFYDIINGGVQDQGYSVNPVTNQPYEEQIVPRGDYTRVLAEFWADGPDSETPPGHWFSILNGVSDHPLSEHKLQGDGPELDPLEWDVKAYFALGGAVHDVSVSTWGIKSWYDYIRPISAIRYMADQGQSTNPDLPNYHPHGVPLIDGYIEIVEEDEPIAGLENEHTGKIKILAWRGHSYIADTETDEAGVGWILAENWWPYQRPSFVTPPFAGYVSGHSTYSRAAAEVLTALTGDAYFPGGMGEFMARKNEFLVFEDGPSTDVILQWAKYRDAADQCSLSRIWGGIHPPVDDINGRFIGKQIGIDAFEKALTYFVPKETEVEEPKMVLYPNPTQSTGGIKVTSTNEKLLFSLYNIQGQPVAIEQDFIPGSRETSITFENLGPGIYFLVTQQGHEWKIVVK